MFRIYVKLKNAVTIISRTEMALAILNRDDKNWKQWKVGSSKYIEVVDKEHAPCCRPHYLRSTPESPIRLLMQLNTNESAMN